MNDSGWLNASAGDDPPYCGRHLAAFSEAYRPVHVYASLLVCVFGSVANSLNIAVLTRREMSSPTNAILTGLAVADLLVMLEYVPFAGHAFLPYEQRLSYGWSVFVLFHSHFAQVCHTVAIWLTVILAVWRYVAVAHPQRSREWCGMGTTVRAIASAYVVCPVLCTPLYLAFDVSCRPAALGPDGLPCAGGCHGARNVTLYHVGLSELGDARVVGDVSLQTVNFWVYSVVIKIIPCVALTVLSLRLVLALVETKKRRRHLEGKTKKKATAEKEKQTDRTTRMLLAVLLLFLITEFPQGILGLLSMFLGEPFFNSCYARLGDLMDILALVNSAVNFILYCSMSRQFRATFAQLFRPRILDRWAPVPQADGRDNGAATQVTQV
ncbi:G-protein coupled receptor dmsr-1-like [Bacillus rossius redtenbacheri]|uniref:G-protein coupled receptor dmsr-1-like n=1 Tax=Bacillus rossius redtenbacheri TaxID=93214 RepID=UPI002FDD1C25